MNADLHMHTIASDGRLTYQEVMELVLKQKLHTFAITDHDTTTDTASQLAHASMLGLNMIPGIELSTEYEGKSVHVLGYFKGQGYQAPGMIAYGEELKHKREVRAKTMLQRLKDLHNIDVTYEDLIQQSHGVIARPHLARAIQGRYPHLSHDDIFTQLIGNESEVYIPTAKLSTPEGINFLRQHDALVILAHPCLLHPRIHDAVLELPFDGIEVFYPRHTTNDRERYRNHAFKKGWLMTAGSDYHGIPGDTNHGFIGDEVLKGKALEQFLTALKTEKKTPQRLK